MFVCLYEHLIATRYTACSQSARRLDKIGIRIDDLRLEFLDESRHDWEAAHKQATCHLSSAIMVSCDTIEEQVSGENLRPENDGSQSIELIRTTDSLNAGN